MRLSKTARIKLFIPVVFQNQDVCVGLKKGGVLTVVRPEVELLVNAMEIPSSLEVDIKDFDPDVLHIFSRTVLRMIMEGEDGWQEMLPEGVSETIIQNRLFGYSRSRIRR